MSDDGEPPSWGAMTAIIALLQLLLELTRSR